MMYSADTHYNYWTYDSQIRFSQAKISYEDIEEEETEEERNPYMD